MGIYMKLTARTCVPCSTYNKNILQFQFNILLKITILMRVYYNFDVLSRSR